MPNHASLALRQELQDGWAADVSQGWAERHTETQGQRSRLRDLREMPQRDAGQELELLRLSMELEPDTDLRQAFADFNAAHPDNAVGLFFEGSVRLDRGEREGLTLLERAMELDPDAIKPACSRAYAFLSECKETELAAEYEARWRSRDAFEAGLTNPSSAG